jgi:hypothetical protein
VRESDYQKHVMLEVRDRIPGCFVVKMELRQGTPDLLILAGTFWAMLEVKVSSTAAVQPNQKYYVDFFDQMSFAAFIFPENESEVLDALEQAFERTRG